MSRRSSGKRCPKAPQRVDVRYEGPTTGTKLDGSAKGADYIDTCADGPSELKIQAEVTTAGDERIAPSADGVAVWRPAGASVARERGAHDLPPRVNPIQGWGLDRLISLPERCESGVRCLNSERDAAAPGESRWEASGWSRKTSALRMPRASRT